MELHIGRVICVQLIRDTGNGVYLTDSGVVQHSFCTLAYSVLHVRRITRVVAA